MTPPAIGLYCALLYCNKNYFALSAAFLGGYCLAGWDLLSLIDGASAVGVFAAVKLVCFKCGFRLKIPAAVAAAFVSMLPRFFAALFTRGVVVQGAVSLVLNTAFCAACCIGCFALFVRKSARFSYDELLSLALLAAAVGMGVYSFDLWGYKPYYTVISALCLLASRFPALPGAGICAAFSLGAGIYMRDMAATGAALAVWAAAKCFRSHGKLPAAVAGEGVYLICGFVTRAFEPFDTLNICLAAAVCAECPERDKCPEIAGTELFKKAIERGMNGGEITADDFPMFVISTCGRLDKVIRECALAADKVNKTLSGREFALKSGAAAAEQMKSTGMVLGRLAAKVGKTGGADGEAAVRITDELGYDNVTCIAAAVLGEGEERRVTLRLRKGDEGKRAVEKAVSKLLGRKVKRTECVFSPGAVTVTYAPREKFSAAFGAAGSVKEGSDRPGDISPVR